METLKKPLISVIVPTYKRAKLLARTVESLLQQSFRDYEILVVDNNAACGEVSELVRKIVLASDVRKDVSIRCVHEKRNGLHYARHAGAREAEAEILVYVDDDVTCGKDYLGEIYRVYSDRSVGCVGGPVLPEWEKNPPAWFDMIPKYYLSILDDPGPEKEVEYIFGCNFSIRKDLLFTAGGFNPDAFGNVRSRWMRGDGEIGLLCKVTLCGKRIVYNPKAAVKHYIPAERVTMAYFRGRAFKKGIEDSFMSYRYRADSPGFVPRFLKSALWAAYCKAHFLLWIVPFNRYRYKNSIKAWYYAARCAYEFKTIFDPELRAFPKKESWLEQ